MSPPHASPGQQGLPGRQLRSGRPQAQRPAASQQPSLRVHPGRSEWLRQGAARQPVALPLVMLPAGWVVAMPVEQAAAARGVPATPRSLTPARSVAQAPSATTSGSSKVRHRGKGAWRLLRRRPCCGCPGMGSADWHAAPGRVCTSACPCNPVHAPPPDTLPWCRWSHQQLPQQLQVHQQGDRAGPAPALPASASYSGSMGRRQLRQAAAPLPQRCRPPSCCTPSCAPAA
jgi:hypothetical protein